MDLEATLGKKIGPLPVIAWGGVVGGGVLLVRFLGGGGGGGSKSPSQITLGDGAPSDGSGDHAIGGDPIGDGNGTSAPSIPSWWTNPPSWWTNPPPWVRPPVIPIPPLPIPGPGGIGSGPRPPIVPAPAPVVPFPVPVPVPSIIPGYTPGGFGTIGSTRPIAPTTTTMGILGTRTATVEPAPTAVPTTFSLRTMLRTTV